MKTIYSGITRHVGFKKLQLAEWSCMPRNDFSMASPTELSKRQFIILRTLHCCNG